MSISSALNNAIAGLAVAGRTTDVIANNVANARTEGYARRTAEIAATSAHGLGGVTMTGILRHADPVLIGARREAEADHGYAAAISAFLDRLETSVGLPDSDRALTNMLADFDARLLEAASRPDANERLEAAVRTAKDMVGVFNSISEDISEMRSNADDAISAQVARLNSALGEVESLNTKIMRTTATGGDASGLLDLRQRVIDEINTFAPVNVAPRDNGAVALYSKGGVILLDGSAREVEFTPANLVTPYMTFEGGHLSGLSIDGRPLRTGSTNNDLPGGTIAANFAVRDELGTDAMAQIDAAARDLVERFQDPAVDPTLSAGDAGLFTDAGLAFDAADEVGLAERLQINTLVDPDAGGEVWRLRDGLGAAAPGPVGQAALINTLRDTLSADRVPASGDFGTGAMSLSGVANGLLSRVGVQRLTADQSLSFAMSSFHSAQQAERAAGVDTDAEMQHMILVEQAYGANARMVQVIGDMIDKLMSI